MENFVARAYLPDWFMVLCGLLFVVVPLYASFFKPFQSNAWKCRAFSFAWLYLIIVYFAQVIDSTGQLIPLLANHEIQTFLGRAGILGVGWAGCVLALNGMNNDMIGFLVKRYALRKNK